MFDWEINSFELCSITIWSAPRLIDTVIRGAIDIAGVWGTRVVRVAAHRVKWGVEIASSPASSVRGKGKSGKRTKGGKAAKKGKGGEKAKSGKKSRSGKKAKKGKGGKKAKGGERS